MALTLRPAFAAAFACSLSCTQTDGRPQPTPAAVGAFGPANGAALRYPVRVAPAADGVVYVSDAAGDQVIGFRDRVAVLRLTGLDRPTGLAVSGSRLFVGNAGRRNVEVYDLSERRFVFALEGAIELPSAIAVAPDGVIYVADSKSDIVRVFGSDGSAAGQIGAPGSAEGQLRFPAAVAADGERVVVGDQANHRIQIFDRAGGLRKVFGGPIAEDIQTLDGFRGRFSSIQSVALTADAIYVLDSYHSHVQVFDLRGEHRGLFGRAGDCASCIRLALDIAVDNDGRVLASDPDHRRVVEIEKEMR